METKKKVTQYDIEKQNNKLFALERRLQYLLNERVALKEKFAKLVKDYKESRGVLQIKEEEKNNYLQYKNDFSKIKELEKKKHDLMLKLETYRNEHQSIKQTLEEYENRKKKLKSKYDKLQKENNELKNREEELDYSINEKKIEKKGLLDFLEEKINEEAQLRSFFEVECKKLKDAKKNFVPPQKKYDLGINPNNNNNNNKNNTNNNLFDFHSLSNVLGSNDEENSIKKNENISLINKEKNQDNNANNIAEEKKE